MESCSGTIKTELEMTEYKNYDQALVDIRDYISYYNFDRKHSALTTNRQLCLKNNST